MPARPAELGRMRIPSVLLACCALALIATRPLPASATLVVTGGKDIVVESVRPWPLDGTSFTNPATSNWYVVTLKFTNTSAYDFTPTMSKFVFRDANGVEMNGQVSGSSALLGISNSIKPLKPDQTGEYTMGFLCAVGATGFIYYDFT